jgi:DNA-directed RNA polymerase subunit RPC12/RpoP
MNQHRSLANALEQAGDQVKKDVLRLLRRALSPDPINAKDPAITTLNGAFAYYGSITYRIGLIDQIHERLTYERGSMLSVKAQELCDMKKLYQEQQKTVLDLITGLFQEKEKAMSNTALSKDVPKKFHNFYKCSECATEWEDEWDSACNDRCPKCNAEIEPTRSEEIKEAL